MAVGNGGRQAPGGLGNRVRSSDADGVEALRPRQFLDQGAEPLRRQKSSFS
jgi:hypothetical protein